MPDERPSPDPRSHTPRDDDATRGVPPGRRPSWPDDASPHAGNGGDTAIPPDDTTHESAVTPAISSSGEAFNDPFPTDAAPRIATPAEDPPRMPSLLGPLVLTLIPVLLISALQIVLLLLPPDRQPAAVAAAATDDATLLSLIELQGRVLVAAADFEARGSGQPSPSPTGSSAAQPPVSSSSQQQLRAQLEVLASTPRSAAAVAAIIAGTPGAGPDAAAAAVRLLDSFLDETGEADARHDGTSGDEPPGDLATEDFEDSEGSDGSIAEGSAAASSTDPAEDDRRLMVLVQQAIDPAVDLDATDEAVIRAELGWAGELLLTRNLARSTAERSAVLRSAMSTALVMLAGFGFLGSAFLVGLVLLIIAAARGHLRPRPLWLRLPGPRGRNYLLGFAFYLWLFLLLSLTAEFLGHGLGWLAFTVPIVAAVAGVMLAKIANRTDWRQLRLDLGLHAGRGILREIGAGMVGYTLILPLLAVGLLLVLVLTVIVAAVESQFGGAATGESGPVASHPIIGLFTGTGTATQVAILLFAAVLVPVVEEVMFRGLLFGALRTRVGFLAASLASATIFALLHPQGLIAAPLLASLAVGFALLREWRGSIIAPITAHAIQNGGLLVFWMLALS